MQRQSRKMGRLMTLHSDTVKAEGEERRQTLMAHSGLCTASAKWLPITEI